MMHKIAAIALLSLLPSLFWLALGQARRRWRLRLERACSYGTNGLMGVSAAAISQERWLGNPNCRFNARSPYLRCAINPEGSCNCSYYQPRRAPRIGESRQLRENDR